MSATTVSNTTPTRWVKSFLMSLSFITLLATNSQAQIDKLTASDGAADDGFGFSVAISGNTVIVGAVDDDDNGSNSGSAYLFDITTGDQLVKLTASDAAVDDRFGLSVAISGNTAIVGAHRNDDDGSNSGSAYLFYVPEPGSIVLLALGAISLLLFRHRSKTTSR